MAVSADMLDVEGVGHGVRLCEAFATSGLRWTDLEFHARSELTDTRRMRMAYGSSSNFRTGSLDTGAIFAAYSIPTTTIRHYYNS